MRRGVILTSVVVAAALVSSGAVAAKAESPPVQAANCAIGGQLRVCAYPTADGIEFVAAGEMPSPIWNGISFQSATPDLGVIEQPFTVVQAPTDSRGFASTTVHLPRGAYTVDLDATPPGAKELGVPLPSFRITVPGRITGPSRWPLPVDLTPSPLGFLEASSDGGVYTFGNATFYGSMAQTRLAHPVIGIAPSTSELGYWLAARDGGVFSFGGAKFYGSLGAIHLHAPIVGIARTSSGKGYWLIGADGGVFTFGDAKLYGSTGNKPLAKPIVGIVPTTTGRGYALVAADGGVFTFGDARFYGSTGRLRLAQPVVGMAFSPDSRGYWLAAADGGVFSFGDAKFYGSGVYDSSSADPNGGNAIRVTFAGVVDDSGTQTGYALAFANGIGYTAFNQDSLSAGEGPYHQESFGAMLGPPATPVVAIASTGYRL